MPNRRPSAKSKSPKKAPAKRPLRKAASKAASTLPPAPTDTAAQPLTTLAPVVPDSPAVAAVKRLPKNSVIRQKALAIMAMRLAGHDNEAIAKELDLSEKSLNQYLWMAGKNGWIPRKRGFADPKDTLEFSLAHKVVANLHDAMDDETRNEKTGMQVKTEVALEVAKGTLFKRFADQSTAPTQSTVLAVRIEMPPGVQTTIREGTTGGQGRWIDAETVPHA